MSFVKKNYTILMVMSKVIKNNFDVDDKFLDETAGDHILEAIEELRSGKGFRCSTVDELFDYLNSDIDETT
jgi:hypothetical protein